MSAIPTSKRDIVDAILADIPAWMAPAMTAQFGDDPEDGPIVDHTAPSSLRKLLEETVPFAAVEESEFWYRIGVVHGVLAHGSGRFDWPAAFEEAKLIMKARRGDIPPERVQNRTYTHPDWYTGDCPHLAPYRTAGGYDGAVLPRYPLRYGSAEVEVCNACEAYRLNVHSPKQWWKGPYLEKYRQAMQDIEDEC
ncbi:hypothetical protein CcrC1_gp106 [Caulobacter phage C1]|nr:hypothetical protein CcrC1_gp106 [Caulobacter phage C1]UTU08334.1 hypothetical protein CcrC2_gp106 [Caulobacter phage C2]UTU08854.1 hypothetical protein CcrJ4_gp103 [Caulobacter phage J4]UTU09408.1 hypothetical protein CcrBL47_gp122 [Caulobacter phage BL47]UTU09968.1 hypothetical protein CcrRB23_gp106 [Caulobacter phage RB23]WGN96993.1 hypothetical protein [Bertelyvirus sp.]